MTITYKGCSRDNLTSNKNMVELIFKKYLKYQHHLLNTSSSKEVLILEQPLLHVSLIMWLFFYLIDLTLTISVYTSR